MDDWERRREKHDDLLKRWHSQYKHLENENCEFTCDGPCNWEQYWRQDPRILLLLKEAHGEWWQPSKGWEPDGRPFSRNVALWNCAIRSLYRDPSRKLEFADAENVPIGPHDVSFVEVKKHNEAKSRSDLKEIESYAKKDKEFLRKQIDLIEPHVVVCGYTIDSYGIIYDGKYDPPEEKLSSDGKCNCYRLGGRLVFDLYHPSSRIAPEGLFSSLCSLITTGKVFEKFAWSKWFVP